MCSIFQDCITSLDWTNTGFLNLDILIAYKILDFSETRNFPYGLKSKYY